MNHCAMALYVGILSPPYWRHRINILFCESRDDLSPTFGYQSSEKARWDRVGRRSNVRFGSKADMCTAIARVCFGSEADIAIIRCGTTLRASSK